MGEDTNIKPGDPEELRRQLADTDDRSNLVEFEVVDDRHET